MDIELHWAAVKAAFDEGMATSKHCAIATVDSDGNPHITPIGFLFLESPSKAFYFEEYTQAIPSNIKANRNLCLMVVNTGFMFWFKSLFRGEFVSAPGIRLYGTAGGLRKATLEEKEKYLSKIKSSRNLKGNKMIWQGLENVREISLTSFKPISYPKMMNGMWTNTVQD